MFTVETGLMAKRMEKAHMSLRKLVKNMLEISCKAKWSQANGSTLMEPVSKADSITTSQRVTASGHSKMATKCLELIAKPE